MSGFQPERADGQGSRRRYRSRRSPQARPARKPRPFAASPADAATHEEQRARELIGVEVQPIGGIFGTASGPVLPPQPRGRLGRVSRMLLRRGRPTVRRAEPSLLTDLDFRVLWLSRLLSQTAQAALLYALLILVVDLSDRTIFNSLFVICSILPSIAFSLPAGIVVDTVSRRALLLLLNGFRFVFMLFLVGVEPSLAGVFAATLGIWIIHQFYSPAEASLLGEIVPTGRYTSAQALFNLALTVSQGLGLVIIAPILLRTGGPRLVFLVCGALWIVAAALTALLPATRRTRASRRLPSGSLRASLGDGWRFARGDRLTFEAIIDDVLVGVGMSALVVIMPFYLERVLGTSKENTVFVFAPAALGLVFGLRIAPRLGRLISEQYSATLALFLFALCVGALGFVDSAYTFLNGTLRLPLDALTDAIGVSPLISVAMLVSIPAGFASAIVNVSARSILLARTPSTLRGQLVATQGLMGNVGSLVPTLIAGIATDLFGVKPIAVAIAVSIILTAMAAHAFGRRTSAPLPLPQT